MAVALPLTCNEPFTSPVLSVQFRNPKFRSFTKKPYHNKHILSFSNPTRTLRRCKTIINGLEKDPNPETVQDDEVNSLGVKAALSMLRFYKREISPILPNSCRYIPTCSEYSMEAYKRYGVIKGTVLTAYRLCRCNPLGGSGYDPPRWFDEIRTSGEGEGEGEGKDVGIKLTGHWPLSTFILG
ncbi:UPF0161 protein [Quillaja saponaria]|uniref:UPF0161 protein n=1 Tax=Quillaja saponaria TaxID=32244 RepID=A0AAD7L2G7_QUISA|nr:UPF0161 protein [Quillaja saponaria]